MARSGKRLRTSPPLRRTMARSGKRPRTACPVCHADVARIGTNAIARHIDTSGGGSWCDGPNEYQQTGPLPDAPQPTLLRQGKQWADTYNEGYEAGQREAEMKALASELSETLTMANQAVETPISPEELERRLQQAKQAGGLTKWWLDQAEAEVDMVVEKAVSYGATDLRDLGYSILEMSGQQRQQILEAEATEIGIVFYALGKLSRIVAAVKEGRTPSYDSWLDLGVYARMAQRVHQSGGWPGLNREGQEGP